VALFLGLIWYAADVLLLIFGGILLAVFLCGLSGLVSKYTGLANGWSLALVVVTLGALLGLGGWLVAGQVAYQLDLLVEHLPGSLRKLEAYLSRYAWGRWLLAQAPSANQFLLGRADVLARITGFFSTVLGVITTLVVILFVGLYAAADPGTYRQGLIRLVPLGGRRRAQEVYDALGRTLRWWLLGRLLDMTVVSVVTTAGLWLLGIPAALALGLVTFVLVFIPYLGPIFSAVPAVLFALSLPDPWAPVYVALLYLGVQTLESYLLMPLVQQRTVQLPPVVTLGAQLLLGVLLGTPGVVFATPLAAAALVLVRMLYVEDTLGDSVGVPGFAPR
jgi:predicted PurR-regulated permease PerM